MNDLQMNSTLANRFAMVSIVVSNLIPLIGVTFLGWNIWVIIWLFWFENLAIGFANAIRMTFAQFLLPQFSFINALENFQLVVFFVIHYFGFCFGHAVFIMLLMDSTARTSNEVAETKEVQVAPPNAASLLGETEEPMAENSQTEDSKAEDGERNTVSPVWLWSSLIAIIVGQIWSLSFGYFGSGEYRIRTAGGLMFEPYAMVVVFHVGISLCALTVTKSGGPIVLLVFLVMGKIVIDILFQIGRHYLLSPMLAMIEK